MSFLSSFSVSSVPSVAKLLLFLLLVLATAAPVVAQDNPILRQRLEQKIVEELSKHTTEETAWYNEKSKDKQSWIKNKLMKIRLASWTEESKTWIWLEDPAKNLTVKLNQFEIRDGRVHFSLSTIAMVRFKVFGRIPKLAKATVGGTVWMKFDINGSTTLGDGKLEGSQISLLNGELKNLQFNNDLGNPLEPVVEDALNDHVRNRNQKLRHSVERAIDKVKV
jgi:hypothetical protein